MRRAVADWHVWAAVAACVFVAVLVAVVVYRPAVFRTHHHPAPAPTRSVRPSAHPTRAAHRSPSKVGGSAQPHTTPAPEREPDPTRHPTHRPSPRPTHRPTRRHHSHRPRKQRICVLTVCLPPVGVP